MVFGEFLPCFGWFLGVFEILSQNIAKLGWFGGVLGDSGVVSGVFSGSFSESFFTCFRKGDILRFLPLLRRRQTGTIDYLA